MKTKRPSTNQKQVFRDFPMYLREVVTPIATANNLLIDRISHDPGVLTAHVRQPDPIQQLFIQFDSRRSAESFLNSLLSGQGASIQIEQDRSMGKVPPSVHDQLGYFMARDEVAVVTAFHGYIRDQFGAQPRETTALNSRISRFAVLYTDRLIGWNCADIRYRMRNWLTRMGYPFNPANLITS